MDRVGIIIFKTFEKQKIFILDHYDGLQEVIVRDARCYHMGSLINYSLIYKNGRFFLDLCTIDDLPLKVGKIDILFLHLILDIVYAFMPLQNPMISVFNHLLLLYQDTILVHIADEYWKKIFLAKLLFLLTVYQEYDMDILLYLRIIEHVPLDRLDLSSLDLSFKKALDRWIHRVFLMHPTMYKKKRMLYLNFI